MSHLSSGVKKCNVLLLLGIGFLCLALEAHINDRTTSTSLIWSGIVESIKSIMGVNKTSFVYLAVGLLLIVYGVLVRITKR